MSDAANHAVGAPLIALAMGDPAGIGAELAAKLLHLPDARRDARIVMFGDRRVLEEGAAVAGVALDIAVVADAEAARAATGNVLVDLHNLDPATLVRGEASPHGGAFATQNFREALLMARRGAADAVVYMPFNKKAMRFASPGYDDEARFVADVTGFPGAIREFNVLPEVWNARVTSHVPLKDVSRHLSPAAILSALELTIASLRDAGIEAPRVLVAGLNPHAGDGGSFGTEEIEIIEPAVADAQRRGWDVTGPLPSDTVFLRALKEGWNAVLTMYHDQGQIAMKLIGFDKGVTMMGGLPFPLCTPAHGTAYDIAGKGIADVGASLEALRLAIRMAARRRVRCMPHG